MKKIDTHGLKISGLKATSGYTCPSCRGEYVEVFYDCAAGEVWGVYQASRSTWTEYRDPDVIRVCGTSQHLTMQAIADRVREAVERRAYLDGI